MAVDTGRKDITANVESHHIDCIKTDENVQFCAGCGACVAVSIPGRAVASLRKSALILNPALALDSINMHPSLLERSSPSSTDTWRFSLRSVLFPTKIMITSFPRSFRTSSIHFDVFRNDARSGIGTAKKRLEIGRDCGNTCQHAGHCSQSTAIFCQQTSKEKTYL